MENEQKAVDFFMGANSPDGFYSYYSEFEKPIIGFRSFLIKGGAGTGKSSIMKRVIAECGANEKLIERLHCSSDPNSLDGVVLYDKKVNIVDATPPHVIEPQYPGGYQTVINLCEYFDEEKLSDRLEKTIEYQTKNNNCHKKCQNYLKCANILLNENSRVVSKFTNFKKIELLAKRIIRKELKAFSNNPFEHKRLLSAVTNQGYKTYSDTPNKLAEKIYLIKDDYGVAGGFLLKIIKNYLLDFGYEIYCCYSPLDPKNKIEHIFIPSLNLGFVTESKYCSFENIKPCSVISYTRFSDFSALKNKKQLINFNKKAANELIEEAIKTLIHAKEIHDLLELQYTDAVDFDRVNIKSNEVIDKIKSREDKN